MSAAFKVTEDGRYCILPDGKRMKRYAPDGRELRRFLSDRTSRVKIIQGPQGSGTSSACCQHIYQQAVSQPLQEDGRRRFRAHIFRETYAKIEETALRTWLDWFPPKEYGRFYETKPFLHEVRVGDLELDVIFMALDDIRDAEAYFKSLETSVIWFNEGQFAQFAVVREAAGRVSPPRFPAVKDGGCNWGGLIIDTNAPPADHWIPIMRGDTAPPDSMSDSMRQALRKPDTWTFFMQAAGLIEVFADGILVGYKPNPDAENLKYLHKDPADAIDLKRNFYMEKIGGQTKQWIDSNIMNRSSVVVDGKPVYPLFRRDAHVADKPLEPVPGITIQVGLDFGRQPAALMGQNLRADWFIHREYIGRDMSMVEFAPLLKTYLSQHFPGFRFSFWGDPAGAQRGQATDRTPFDVMRQHGMMVLPAPNPQNNRTIRHEAVNAVLMRRSAAGTRNSALLVDPRCVTYITGMSGGYYMRRIRVSDERYAEEPEKNQYSHICEAGENLLLGGGEGRGVVLGSEPMMPIRFAPKLKSMRRAV